MHACLLGTSVLLAGRQRTAERQRGRVPASPPPLQLPLSTSASTCPPPPLLYHPTTPLLHARPQVPFTLYLMTHAYFCLYHALANVLIRRVRAATARFGPGAQAAAEGVVVFLLAYATAYSETLTIAHFPYYTFKDRRVGAGRARRGGGQDRLAGQHSSRHSWPHPPCTQAELRPSGPAAPAVLVRFHAELQVPSSLSTWPCPSPAMSLLPACVPAGWLQGPHVLCGQPVLCDLLLCVLPHVLPHG